MIPKHIDQVSNEWLGGVLGTPVKEQTRTQIGQGIGLLGDIYQVVVKYSDAVAAAELNAPASVVVKLPSSFEENRAQGVALGMFEAEVRFYNELAPSNTPGLPAIYHAEIDSGTADFVIVMEDLSALSMVNQSDGMSGADAHNVVQVLASLHARWWNQVDSPELAWIPTMTGPRIDFVDQYLTGVYPTFAENFGHRLPAGGLEIYQRFLGNYAKINQVIAARSPWTLAHQDFRVENLMFGTGDSDRVVVIDWQGIGRGPGAYDLGYVLGGSMEPAVRREHEQVLVRAYHEQLLAGGVTGYSLEQLWDDYGHSQLMGGLSTSILTGGAMDLSNERGTELIATMASRHVQAALDHDGAARLKAILD